MRSIRYVTGDLLKSEQEALVNTVNLEGYMGKGIAYQFKKQFPKNNEAYIQACKNKDIDIGKVFTFKEDGKIIINFPTKDKWREKTKIEYIKDGLVSLNKIVKNNNIKSIAIPPLGCGNGGLDWNTVKPIMEDGLSEIKDSVDILIYEPSQNFTSKPKHPPKMSFSSFLILRCMRNLIYTDKVSIQKAVFLLELYAKNNFFKFRENKFGPYSHGAEMAYKTACEFLEYYNLDNKSNDDLDDAIRMVYRNINSKAVEAQAQFYTPILAEAKKLWNSLKGKKNLEIVATILHIISRGKAANEEEIVDYFLNEYPKQNPENFHKYEILDLIENLIQRGIIQKDLLGSLYVSI